MGAAKIHFSQEEILLAQNADILLTKNRVIEKIYLLFGNVAEAYQSEIRATDETHIREAASVPPKISRGENYKGLPYVMLDFPRMFTRDNVFSIRTFFWWGNYLSVTLHLKGSFQQLLSSRLSILSAKKNRIDFFVSNGDDEWDHDVEAGGYQPFNYLQPGQWKDKLERDPFIKITTKAALDNWEHSESFLVSSFRSFVELTRISSRDDERGL